MTASYWYQVDLKFVIAMMLNLLLTQIALVQADFDLSALFYEYENLLGLQCSQCSDGSSPVCCDHEQRFNNCISTPPYNCDTRFRLMLRPYGSPIETAPLRDFPYFTPSSGANRYTFPIGPGGFLALPNPFIITQIGPWTVSCSMFCSQCSQF